MVDQRAEHHDYVRRTGEDMPDITHWSWVPKMPTMDELL
jgi:phosphoketolase